MDADAWFWTDITNHGLHYILNLNSNFINMNLEGKVLPNLYFSVILSFVDLYQVMGWLVFIRRFFADKTTEYWYWLSWWRLWHQWQDWLVIATMLASWLPNWKCGHFDEIFITGCMKFSSLAAQNFHHWVHWKLSFWQLPVQPVMKISSK